MKIDAVLFLFPLIKVDIGWTQIQSKDSIGYLVTSSDNPVDKLDIGRTQFRDLWLWPIKRNLSSPGSPG